MPRLAPILLALATVVLASPPRDWPQRGVDVGNDAIRLARRHGDVLQGRNNRGVCAAIVADVWDAAEADGLEARGHLWLTPHDWRDINPATGKAYSRQLHANVSVKIPDGRWCGYDYWTAGTRYRCTWDESLLTDPSFRNRVACCRRYVKYLGDIDGETRSLYRQAQEVRRALGLPGYKAARQAARRMRLEAEGRSSWIGDP